MYSLTPLIAQFHLEHELKKSDFMLTWIKHFLTIPVQQKFKMRDAMIEELGIQEIQTA